MSAIKPFPNTIASSRVLVIGGTAGIGAGVVSGALANGASVHISSSNEGRIAAKVAEFKTIYPGASIAGTAADLSDENTLEANVKRVLEEAVKALGGPIDHFVFTAGDAFHGYQLSEVDAKTYLRQWNVRFLGPLLFAKTIAGSPNTYLKLDNTSSITFTSGTLVHKPVPGVAHFIGWAGAVEALGRGLAIDLAPIRVNIVSPGAIATEMLASLGEEMVQKHFAEKTLTKRVGTVNEAAEAYLYSMRSGFLTGEVLKIDGGASYA